MSTSDQAAVDALWGDAVAGVSPGRTSRAVVPSTSFYSAEQLHHVDNVGTSRAAIDGMWTAAVARVNAEEGLAPAPSDVRPGRRTNSNKGSSDTAAPIGTSSAASAVPASCLWA